MSTNEPCSIGVLFCDVAGSTRLYRDLGDDAALRIVEHCLGIAAEVVQANGGRIVKTIGDEFMAVFEDVCAMCDAAVAVQRRFEDDQGGGIEGQRLQLRIGFHFGPAVHANDDYFGTTVNMAARMVAIAKGGQIITTGALADSLPPLRRAATRALVGVYVKGAGDDVRVAEVLWHLAENQTTVFSFLPAAEQRPAAGNDLRITYRGRRWLFDERHASVSLGREPANDIVVDNDYASRRHATIERRGDKWVLVDHSTNGTYVTLFGAEEFCMRREELVLRDVGTLGIGRSVGLDRANGLDFALTVGGAEEAPAGRVHQGRDA
ncbi:adenylate/guanylate cyclase domain-containing protein [Methylobacterium nodulans]|uniref:Adenylate/guanylate cyclase n=1 Tax=Methylobacterium nodulans (strain LMG 21967 / CNCM I-2342 / ORS 2060) TaxID=460265 RepID=B8IKV0_METNO|nr:adenylate/guanylate cyclase domain-containing protein [Methylobacterium nodulans]ACL56307.1 adenylate/guanylate cyclase [Methylobacterium nodulans ORS 2060]